MPADANPIGLPDDRLAVALLDAMEHHILPLTREGVATGSKIYGAAVLRKSDGAVVLAETNNEAENPLWHGEIHLLKMLHEHRPVPDPATLIFLATHEPCPMCLSAISLAGYDNFFEFFSHEEQRDPAEIPHDLRILDEVFRLPPGGYRRQNGYWTARTVSDVIAGASPENQPALRAQDARIRAEYADLLAAYQARREG